MAAFCGNVGALWNGGRYSVAPFKPGKVEGRSGDCGRQEDIVEVMCGLDPAVDDVIITGTG